MAISDRKEVLRMDVNLIHTIASVLAVVVLAVIVYRRKSSASV